MKREQCYTACGIIGERERANLIVQQVRFFCYIYIYIYHGRCHTANRLRVKLTQHTIFHRCSPCVYRHGDSSRRCTVATVQDEANPSSSQPAASCCVASESTEAHRDGWREYVLAEESVLPRNRHSITDIIHLLSSWVAPARQKCIAFI